MLRDILRLEDGDWQSADQYCEKVLDIDPQNGEAYLGKLMAELKVYHREELAKQKQPFDDRNNFKKAVRFGSDQLKSELYEEERKNAMPLRKRWQQKNGSVLLS